MTKDYILSFTVFLIATATYGQKTGDYYVSISISIDRKFGGRLQFLNDTTIEFSSIPRHMQPSIKTTYKFTATDSTIEIFPKHFASSDSIVAGPYIQTIIFDSPISLTKIKGGFIDYSKSLIYVRQKDFGNNPDIAYIIDGKTYIQDMGVTNGYGLLRKSPKTNKALQKRLKGINKDNCTFEFVRGLNAYQRFGIERVYGVFVITTTK